MEALDKTIHGAAIGCIAECDYMTDILRLAALLRHLPVIEDDIIGVIDIIDINDVSYIKCGEVE